MRRHLTIPAKSVVAATLLLTGAIYVAAEIRQAMARRYQAEANTVEPALASATSSSSLPQTQTVEKPAATTPPAVGKGLTDEVAAERQAAKIPAQKPPKKSAKDTHQRQIVVSIPDRRLALLEDGALVKVYPVAVGASDTPSPDGEFTVINQIVDPGYWHEGKAIAPGKENPLGTRWMGLSMKGYGIHGTNMQSSVGKAASHGCFRMRKRDVEELFSRVQVGDQVSVRGERDELTASLFTLSTGVTLAATNTKPEVQMASAATASAAADEQQ